MGYGLLADLVLLLHAAFVVFVAAGGLLALWRPRIAWLHLPAAAWGTWVMLSGWICPLTPLENMLRHAAGQDGYGGGFIAHYVTALIYPQGLTRAVQIGLGALVLLGNLILYAICWRHHAGPVNEKTHEKRPKRDSA